MVRNVCATPKPKAYHLFEADASPNGEVNLIGGDDYSSQEFTGSILVTCEGFSYMIDLVA